MRHGEYEQLEGRVVGVSSDVPYAKVFDPFLTLEALKDATA